MKSLGLAEIYGFASIAEYIRKGKSWQDLNSTKTSEAMEKIPYANSSLLFIQMHKQTIQKLYTPTHISYSNRIQLSFEITKEESTEKRKESKRKA